MKKESIQRYLMVWCLMMLIIGCGFLTFEKVEKRQAYVAFAEFVDEVHDKEVVEKTNVWKGAKSITSVPNVVEMKYLEQTPKYQLSDSDYNVLLKIVEAEAGCEDLLGRQLVANVILNRVDNPIFPNSVKNVVYQKAEGKYQFSPVANGRINNVKVTEETKQAVEKALNGEDKSNGALYFMARKYAKAENVNWFDTHLTKLVAHGGHEFFG